MKENSKERAFRTQLLNTASTKNEKQMKRVLYPAGRGNKASGRIKQYEAHRARAVTKEVSETQSHNSGCENGMTRPRSG
jgi:hypothetical protein